MPKVSCNNRPQVVFNDINIFSWVYYTINRCQCPNTFKTQATPDHNTDPGTLSWVYLVGSVDFIFLPPDINSVVGANDYLRLIRKIYFLQCSFSVQSFLSWHHQTLFLLYTSLTTTFFLATLCLNPIVDNFLWIVFLLKLWSLPSFIILVNLSAIFFC